MFLNFKFTICLFPTLLWVTCNSSSIFSFLETCYKKHPKPDISKLDAKSIVEDINKFYKNFNDRYNELETFIKNNLSQSNDVDVKFFLYTPKNTEKPDELKKQTLKESHFNYKLPIKVLIHGLQPLQEKYYGTEPLKHAMLVRGNYNVIIMGYKQVASMPYTQALKYSFLVAKNAADFLQQLLKTFKLTAKRVHLIGFEFGGQLAGNIGNHMPGLARISALDPAGALFERFRPEHRISADDAFFVDIIHTSTKKFPQGLGMEMPAGHQDFYPNGGERQPGCKHNITAEEAGGVDAAEFKNALCDNVRSLEYFTESVCDRYCTFRGRKCDSYKDYEGFRCPPFVESTKTMGFYASKGSEKEPAKNTKFYLDTNSQYPYCSIF